MSNKKVDNITPLLSGPIISPIDTPFFSITLPEFFTLTDESLPITTNDALVALLIKSIAELEDVNITTTERSFRTLTCWLTPTGGPLTSIIC
ncbi:hypothetical protein D3C72_1761740 [compost metagenome]